MDKFLTGFLMTLLCWLTSCIIGILLVNSFLPPTGTPITTFECMTFIAIGWIVFNCNHLIEEEYKTSFNMWMTFLFISTFIVPYM